METDSVNDSDTLKWIHCIK